MMVDKKGHGPDRKIFRFTLVLLKIRVSCQRLTSGFFDGAFINQFP